MRRIIYLSLVLMLLGINLGAQVNGVLTQTDGRHVLKVWGTHAERGYAHGYLLGQPILQIMHNYVYPIVAMSDSSTYNSLLNFFASHFNTEQKYLQEAQGIVDGMLSSASGAWFTPLQRNLVKEDILLYNSIYDLYYYARYELGNGNLELNCATLASWGSATQADTLLNGGLVISRLMDWNQDAALIANPLLLISHPSETDEQDWVSFTYPGMIGAISAISASGKAAFLNTGNYHAYGSALNVHPITLSIRNGIERADLFQDGWDDVMDILTAVSADSSLSGMIVHAVSDAFGPMSIVVETNNLLGTTYRSQETGGIIPPYHLAATNHFRALTNPVCCSRYANIADSLNANSAMTAKRQLNVIKGAAGLENNLMALQYTIGSGLILWSSATLSQPAYQIPMTPLWLDELLDFSTDVQDETNVSPVARLQVYPNPVRTGHTITFRSSSKLASGLEIYNLKGQKVATLQGDGKTWQWNGRTEQGMQAAAGIYLCRLQNKRERSVPVKLLLLR
jgi:hypothetical protein